MPKVASRPLARRSCQTLAPLRTPETQPVVLLASSRSAGNTFRLAELILPAGTARVIDLTKLKIGYYSYGQENAGDDFVPLVEELLLFQVWVLATPLYWYTMSAQAKTFIDRLSDLLSARKEVGRRLRGKALAVVCAGSDAQPPSSFAHPFELTCQYLGMRFLGSHYCPFEESRTPSPELASAAAEFGRALIHEAANPSIERTF